ncbi:uncharacterized protein LOC126653544 isoform X2 [Mercurialis annua]|uniref:uncharacterized protein LOC126653544 isoform X2 n=1 Tax=Mercurialis annua TaxID=3986 RepID=UPI00215F0AED|nr:uncharacterized protein LOC126653544 isoform X2 [Mercurialis annua]
MSLLWRDSRLPFLHSNSDFLFIQTSHFSSFQNLNSFQLGQPLKNPPSQTKLNKSTSNPNSSKRKIDFAAIPATMKNRRKLVREDDDNDFEEFEIPDNCRDRAVAEPISSIKLVHHLLLFGSDIPTQKDRDCGAFVLAFA